MNKTHAPIEKESSLIHCKSCRGLLVKDMKTDEMDGNASFLMKCPHCKKDVVVTIKISKHPSVEIN